jgi:hypothetical protein
MFYTIKRLIMRPHPQPAPVEKTIIDQRSYYDALERKSRRWREDEEEAERQRQRIAGMVWEWARDTIRYRSKRPLPAKLPRAGDVREWLDGLHVQEIFALSKADGFSIQHHIDAGALIAGVRRLQKLPPAEIRFPARKIADEDVGRAGGGGGPRRR